MAIAMAYSNSWEMLTFRLLYLYLWIGKTIGAPVSEGRISISLNPICTANPEDKKHFLIASFAANLPA